MSAAPSSRRKASSPAWRRVSGVIVAMRSTRVVRRQAIALFRLHVGNFRQHSLEFFAGAARGTGADIPPRVQGRTLLGEGGGDEWVEQTPFILREILPPPLERLWNVDI